MNLELHAVRSQNVPTDSRPLLAWRSEVGEIEMLRKIIKYLRWFALGPIRLVHLSRDIEKLNLAVGMMMVEHQMRELEDQGTAGTLDLGRFERRVFSQGGEDGVLQLLTRLVPITHRIFVEFGVEDYRESNTRFLLLSGDWKGLIMDGDAGAIRAITEDPIVQRNPLVVLREFITAENIDTTISSRIHEEDIGVLSIDVDGNDYWIWRGIRSIRPAIVIVEYNYRFGPERSVTVPYDQTFVRGRDGTPFVYYGASLSALDKLAKEKGYSLVHCCAYGNNAFFVREDLRPDCVRALSPQEAYVPGRFREVSGADGNLLTSHFADEAHLIEGLEVIEV